MEVGRELEVGDMAAVIAHDDDEMDRVEFNVQEPGLLGYHFLLAKSFIFVNAEVEHMILREKWRRSRQLVSALIYVA